MGGKGSGRPKGSYKPLSQHLAELQEDIEELEEYVGHEEYVDLAKLSVRVISGKIDNLRRKAKLEEYRRKMKS